MALRCLCRTRDRRGGALRVLVVLAVVVGTGMYFGYQAFSRSAGKVKPGELIVETASRGPFDHIVLEQGEIESSRNTEINCQVKSRGNGGVAILWVIDEGTRVKTGDKLVELDASELEIREKEQRIQVITEEARVATARAEYEQAVIAKEEYLQGIFKTEEAELLSEKQIAEQERRRATLAFQSSERLVFKGLINALQLDADRFALANAETKLQSAIDRLDVLRKLTKKKFLVQYDSDIDSANASVKAAESELLEEQNDLNEIIEQIRSCVIYAPADGVVVHANKYSSRGGNAEFVVEPGATVRERQTIIRLPDPTQMQVKCKVNESRITLIQEGMPVRLSVDAIPGLQLNGRVTKVNRYAEPGSWFNSSIKEYATSIEILDPPEVIRTGMTAEAQIFVEQLDDSLQIPIQGLYEHGGEMFSLIKRGPDEFETVRVALQATNDTMASIGEGINENDQVVLNLREHLPLMDLPELSGHDNSEMRKIAMEAPASSRSSESDLATQDPPPHRQVRPHSAEQLNQTGTPKPMEAGGNGRRKKRDGGRFDQRNRRTPSAKANVTQASAIPPHQVRGGGGKG